MVRLTRIRAVSVEMEGEEIPPRVICAIFEIGGGKTGNNFLRRGDRVLQPNYIFPSRDPLGTNKNDGECWRNFPVTWAAKINIAGLERTTPCNSEFKR